MAEPAGMLRPFSGSLCLVFLISMVLMAVLLSSAGMVLIGLMVVGSAVIVLHGFCGFELGVHSLAWLTIQEEKQKFLASFMKVFAVIFLSWRSSTASHWIFKRDFWCFWIWSHV